MADEATEDTQETTEETETQQADENHSDSPDETKSTAEDDSPRDEQQEETPEFSTDLLQRAKELGLGESEARAHGTPDALDLVLSNTERALGQIHRSRQQAEREAAETAAKAKAEVADGTNADAGKQTESLPDPPKGMAFTLPEEHPFDEDTAEVLQTMSKHYGSQLVKIQQESESRMQVVQQQSQAVAEALSEMMFQQNLNQADHFFATNEKYYGKGGTLELQAGGAKEFSVREEVLNAADDLAIAKQMRGQKPDPLGVRLERAQRLVLGDKLEQQIRKDVSDRSRDKRGQWTTRGKPRTTRELPRGEEKALNAMAEYKRSIGKS